MNKQANEILADVLDDLAELQHQTKSRDIKSCVQAGAALWAISERAKDALTDLKSSLRAIALNELNGEAGTWNQDAEDCWAKVVVPNETLRIRKGSNPITLQDMMTTEEWEAVFEIEQKVVIKKDAQGKIASMASGPVRDHLLDQIETVAGTPRVSLKRSE